MQPAVPMGPTDFSTPSIRNSHVATSCSVAELFFTAEDRARLAPAALPTMTYILKEEAAPYGETPVAPIPTTASVTPGRTFDHTTIEDVIFMSERIAVLMKQ